jgi:hypothetical protein
LPCGCSWISANKVTGPMPGGGGGKPHGCTCSGDGGPASGGAETDGACADAVSTVAAEPQNTSESAQTALANFVVMAISSDAFAQYFPFRIMLDSFGVVIRERSFSIGRTCGRRGYGMHLIAMRPMII